jgi:outer membrane protein OmpA-like peptidoglycan-associated protein/type II secretory pathway pseudopilin PulG
MKVTRVFALVGLAAVLGILPAYGASGFLDSLKKEVENKAAQKAKKAVDQAADQVTGDAASQESSGTQEQQPSESGSAASSGSGASADQLKPGQGAWANYDFKPGTRVLFADDFMQDEVGDFPRRFEFVSGNMEIVEWQQGRWLRLSSTSKFNVVLPEVLPQRYTMEFDFSVPGGEMWIYPDYENNGSYYLIFGNGGVAGVNGPNIGGRSAANAALSDKVVRARVMADGAYVKLYVNDKRLANVPNFGPARTNKILFWVDANETNPAIFGNFRIAAGGKKLYDSLAQDGRVATQGIYFDTGSDRIRPESTPTLKEIAAMLTEHPDLRLLIEGHTDNVGAAAANQSLSEKRAAAVRQALIEGFGVAGDRLTTKGLGATKPVAANDTPEGRQNNRRVELVRS